MGMNKERFDRLAEGLLFMSETDAPLTYYELGKEEPCRHYGRIFASVCEC